MKRLFILIFIISTIGPAHAFKALSGSSSGGGAPSGAAGGSLTGTYPDPGLAAPYGATTYTNHGLIKGQGSSNLSAMAVCGTGSFPFGQAAADPICSTLLLPNAATTDQILCAISANTIGACTTVPTAATAALTGDVTKSAGSNATTVTGGANLLGIVGKVNDLGTIGSGGTASCDLSLGPICAFAVGAGAVTVAKPTNGAAHAQYRLDITATASITLTFASGWQYIDPTSLAVTAAPTMLTLANGATLRVYYSYDGSNFNIDVDGMLAAHRGFIRTLTVTTIAGTLTGAVTNTAQNIATTSGTIGSTTGIISSTTGAIGPTGGGVLQSYGGTAPTCACTGGSPSCTVGGTQPDNTSGQIQLTGGTAVTTCTLTFSASGTFHAAPICGFYDANASIAPVAYSTGAVSTSTAVVDFVAVSAANINYICIGH